MSKVIRNVFYVAIGVLTARLLGGVRSFLLAALIEPAQYGIWTVAQTLAALAPILGLGTLEALLKQVPFYRGKNDRAGISLVESSVYGSIVLSAPILAVVFLVFPGCLPFQFVQENLLVTQITAAAAAIGFFTAYYSQRCAAHEEFRLVSAFDAARSLFDCVCLSFFAWRWGLLGAALGFLLAELLNWVTIAHLSCKAHGLVRPCFRLAPMADAVRIGLPITIIWWVYAIHASVGRLTVVTYLGNTAAGYYGAGSAIAMLFALVPMMIGRVLYPRINAQLGANAGFGDLRKSVVVPTSALTLVLPLMQVLLFFLLPILYTHFLPKYVPGLRCAQILVLGAFFVALIRNGANYLIAADRQYHLMKYVLISVAANALGSVALASSGFGISGIAMSTSLATALLASLIWWRVLLELGYDRGPRLSILAEFAWPLLAMLGAVIILQPLFAGGHPFALPLPILFAIAIYMAAILAYPNTRRKAHDLYRRLLLAIPRQSG